MIEITRVFPECDADTLFVELLLQKGKPSHYHGITNTTKAILKSKRTDFIIGVVDTDKFKRDNADIKSFSEVVTNRLNDENLLVIKLPNTNKHIIRLHPAFERWIWEVAKKCGVNPGEFGFNDLDKIY